MPARIPVLVILGGAALLAQEPAEPASSGVMVYQRRPLRPSISCRAEDFEAAGLLCSEEEPCRLFLELTAVEAVGPKVLVVGNVHTASATLSSLALLSDDAGGSWREPFKRHPGAGLESIQLLDAQLGFIAAQPQGALPSDPYLLVTTDGGATWQKLPLWQEEGRAGLLQQFQFDSKDHGWALVDRSSTGPGITRYELYETLNAGGSWMLRESSARPIAPKWPQRRPSEWRLREDAKLTTYEIERRVGTVWQRVANFQTVLGVCKSLESKQIPLPPPPPIP